MRRSVLHLLFFGSGAAGLVYQVLWARQFGTLFGNAAGGTALVTAVYMLGLGLGAGWGGRLADRLYARDARAPLWAYAGCELAIGAWAVALGRLVPLLERPVAALSRYAVDGQGWAGLSLSSEFIRYGLGTALVLPATFLMGATLPLLVRSVLGEPGREAGVRVGWLYAVNTLGGAAGAWMTDAWLIPAVGQQRTAWAACAVNGVAGFGAWALSRARAQAGADASAEGAATVGGGLSSPSPETRRGAPAWAVGVALALAGAGGMGLELAWYRYLGAVLGAYRAVFSELLAVMLCAFVVGTLGAAAAERRFARAEWLLQASLVALVLSAAGCLALFDADAARSSLAHSGSLGALLQVVALPSLFMGASFPLAHALVLDARGTVGRRSGLLYLANTLGAVVGSLASALLLVPLLGVQHAVGVLLGVLAAAVVLLAVSARAVGPARLLPVAALAGVGAWMAVDPALLLRRTFPILRVEGVRALALDEGVNEAVLVAEAEVGRALYTNGHSMSGTVFGSQRYMRAMAHVPLLLAEDPRRAVVICFGVGNTAHAASLHPLESLDVVDLSRHVLEHGEYFASTNGGVLRNPRVHVTVNDGRQHLRMLEEGSLDLVTLEPPPIDFAGVAGLYSREFYALAKSRLRDGGFVTQWLPLYQVPHEVARSLARAFVDEFPGAAVLSGHGAELVLLGRKGRPVDGGLGPVRARLEALPAVRADLERMRLLRDEEWAGLSSLSPTALAALVETARPLTDDWPISEYASRNRADGHRMDAAWYRPDPAAWCGSCATAPGVAAWTGALSGKYATEAFLAEGTFELP